MPHADTTTQQYSPCTDEEMKYIILKHHYELTTAHYNDNFIHNNMS